MQKKHKNKKQTTNSCSSYVFSCYKLFISKFLLCFAVCYRFISLSTPSCLDGLFICIFPRQQTKPWDNKLWMLTLFPPPPLSVFEWIYFSHSRWVVEIVTFFGTQINQQHLTNAFRTVDSLFLSLCVCFLYYFCGSSKLTHKPESMQLIHLFHFTLYFYRIRFTFLLFKQINDFRFRTSGLLDCI